MPDFDPENPLFVEVMAERASAYFTTVRKMEAALSALATFDKLRLPPDAANKRRRAELFAQAAEQVWFFMIQREAMKLPYYEEIFADFGIPDEVRRGMGPNLGRPDGQGRKPT